MNTLIFYNIFPTQESNVIYGRSPTDFTILTDFTSAEPAMVASTFKEDLNILKDAQTHPDPSKVCMPFLHLFSATHSFFTLLHPSGGKGVKNGDVENSFHIHYIFESSQPRVEAAPEEATLEIAQV